MDIILIVWGKGGKDGLGERSQHSAVSVREAQSRESRRGRRGHWVQSEPAADSHHVDVNLWEQESGYFVRLYFPQWQGYSENKARRQLD